MVTNIRDLQVRDDFIVTIAGTVINVREDEFLLQDSTGQIWVDAIRRGSGTIDLAIGEQVTVTGDLDDLEDFDAIRITRADGSEVIGQPRPGNGRPGNGRPENGRPGNGRPGRRPGNGRPENDRPIDLDVAPRVNIGDLRVRDDLFVTITGTVTQIRDDEFILRDRTGQVLVDGIRRGGGSLDIAIGDRLTVVGDLDDQDFDALRITRPDGSIVASQPAQPRNRRRDGDFRDGRENGDFSGPPPWAGRPGGPRGWQGDEFAGPPPWAGQPGGPRSFLQSTDQSWAQPLDVDSSIF
ncbi:MAG: hypothetical protein IGS54_07305 [Elainella sp. C42_A2020_010]|nr:hypothetical protein [Elainella sp. C42_A2020_010]